MNEPTPLGESISPELLARIMSHTGGIPVQAEADRDSHTETLEEATARRALQARNRAARWLARRPRMYQEANLEDMAQDPAQTAAAVLALDWWTRPDACTLVAAGTVGTGKTHLAYALGNRAMEAGRWVEVWTVADLLEDLRPNGDPGAERRARDCDLLILDDLMAANVSPWAMETLTAILDYRIAQHRRQIVTTNAPSAALEEAWGGRLFDRLLFHSVTVVMAGESRRRAAW